jgi:hypothetical protein
MALRSLPRPLVARANDDPSHRAVSMRSSPRFSFFATFLVLRHVSHSTPRFSFYATFLVLRHGSRSTPRFSFFATFLVLRHVSLSQGPICGESAEEHALYERLTREVQKFLRYLYIHIITFCYVHRCVRACCVAGKKRVLRRLCAQGKAHAKHEHNKS